MTEKKWADVRKMRETRYYSKYSDMIKFSKNLSNSTELLGVFGGEAAVMFILVILIILSFVIFILNCCCKVCQTDKRSKGWLIASKILLLIIFILFIAFIVFISLSEKNYNPFICSLMRLPAGSLEGFKDENNQFIGIKNIL